MDTRKLLAGALLLIVIGAALGIGYNLLSPRPLPWKGKKMVAVTLEDAEHPAKDGSGAAEAATPSPTPGTEAQSPTASQPAASTQPGDVGAATAGTQGAQMQREPAASSEPAAAASEPAAGASEPATGTSEPAGGASRTETAAASTPPASQGQTQDASPRGEKQFKPTDPSLGREDLYKDIPESEYPIEIHLAKAKDFYDRGGLLVLDARDLSEYEEGHIKGAVDAPTDEKIADLDWMEATAKDPRPIMVYCSGGDCELSMTLGFEIAHTGHRRVLVFEDGYPAWKDAGYPTATGDTP